MRKCGLAGGSLREGYFDLSAVMQPTHKAREEESGEGKGLAVQEGARRLQTK